MLITNDIEVILTKFGIKKTITKYDLDPNLKVGDVVKIAVEKLSSKSHIVEVICDYCGFNLSMKYFKYLKGVSVVNKTACKDCVGKKCKDVFNVKYGVDNPFQLEEFKEKIKLTNLERYGFENASKSNKIKNKTKNTCIEKYGSENYFETDEFKEKSKLTHLEKYDVDNYSKTDECKNKMRETNLGRYGVDHYSKTNEYKNKVKETSLEKYNVDNYAKTEESKVKAIQTNLEKYEGHYSKTDEYKNKVKESNNINYGVDWYYQSDDFKQKSIETNLERYGMYNFSKTELHHSTTKIGNNKDYIRYLNDNISLFNCDKGHEFEIHKDNYHGRFKSNLPLCTVCYPIGDQKSIKEKELLEYIKFIYSGEIISSYRDGLEIDIYLPELKIGFEFNGLYWHSDKFKDKNYHLDKTNYFNDKGIRIFHVWEDDYDLRLDIVKSRIKNLLGLISENILVEKCIVKEVNAEDSKEFLNSNHIQGDILNLIRIGLYYNNELVSLMTFENNKGNHNLNRFCNKLNTNIIGDTNKLLDYFEKTYKPEKIISYVDKDWLVNDLYHNLGFKNIKEGIPELLEKSLYKVYNCGKVKFEKI